MTTPPLAGYFFTFFVRKAQVFGDLKLECRFTELLPLRSYPVPENSFIRGDRASHHRKIIPEIDDRVIRQRIFPILNILAPSTKLTESLQEIGLTICSHELTPP